MHVIGKKKKATPVVSGPQENLHDAVEDRLMSDDEIERILFQTACACPPELPWWKEIGEFRGCIVLPTGFKAYYCQDADEMSQIRGANFPDICAVKVTDTLSSVYQMFGGNWVFIRADLENERCVGAHGECPHLEHHIDAQKHRCIDDCPNNNEGNCIIVNNLLDEIDTLKEAVQRGEQTEKDTYYPGDFVEQILEADESITIDDHTSRFFGKGKRFRVHDTDPHDDTWDICIEDSGSFEHWVNSKYFKKVSSL